MQELFMTPLYSKSLDRDKEKKNAFLISLHKPTLILISQGESVSELSWVGNHVSLTTSSILFHSGIIYIWYPYILEVWIFLEIKNIYDGLRYLKPWK